MELREFRFSTVRNNAWRVQVVVTPTYRDVPEMIVHDGLARGHAPLFEVVIEIPFRLRPGGSLDPQARNQRRPAPLVAQECDSRERRGCFENIPLSVRQCPAKLGIQEIFLADSPTEDFAGRRTLRTRPITRVLFLPGMLSGAGFALYAEHRETFRIPALLHTGLASLGIDAVGHTVFHFIRV